MKPELVAKIEAARQLNPEHLGVLLAEQCLKGDVPVSFVSAILAVSHVTIYRWYSGESVPQAKDAIRKIKRLTWTLKTGIAQQKIPMSEFDPSTLLDLWKQSKTSV